MVEDRAPFQTEAAVCSQQGIAGHFRSHLAIAQDEAGRIVNTARHVVHWIRQMVRPPRRIRA